MDHKTLPKAQRTQEMDAFILLSAQLNENLCSNFYFIITQSCQYLLLKPIVNCHTWNWYPNQTNTLQSWNCQQPESLQFNSRSRSFIMLPNLGQTLLGLIWQRGEKYMQQLWQIHVIASRNTWYSFIYFIFVSKAFIFVQSKPELTGLQRIQTIFQHVRTCLGRFVNFLNMI